MVGACWVSSFNSFKHQTLSAKFMHVSIFENHSISRIGIRELIKEHFDNSTFSENTHDLTDINSTSLKTADLVFICFETVNLRIWGEIRDINKTAPIIVCCNQIKYYELIKILKDGAKGILLKNQPVHEFAKCIKSVLEGQRYICHEGLMMIAEQVIGRKNIFVKSLNPREKVVAAYLMEGHGTNFIGQKLNLPVSAVSIAKHRIFEKLRIKNILQLREMMNSGMLRL